MKKGDRIFVYGALRPGKSAAGSMRNGAEHVRTTHINGDLFNIGWFPGVKNVKPGEPFIEDSGGVVEGDMFVITDEALVGRLDGYEGYPDLYDRQQVKTQCGETAWVYTYNPAVSEDQRIATGRWE